MNKTHITAGLAAGAGECGPCVHDQPGPARGQQAAQAD